MTRHHLLDPGLTRAAQFDPDTVTPGVLGFIVTFLVAAAVVLLVLDMTRRIRRTRYRVEIGEKLDAEQSDAGGTQDAARMPDDTDPEHGLRDIRSSDGDRR